MRACAIWMRVSLNQTPSRAVRVRHSLFRFDHMQARPTSCAGAVSDAYQIPLLPCRRLPDRIRPSIFAFGTLADGYLPFQLPDGSEASIGLTSVVMKVGDCSDGFLRTCPAAKLHAGVAGICTRCCRPASSPVFLQVQQLSAHCAAGKALVDS